MSFKRVHFDLVTAFYFTVFNVTAIGDVFLLHFYIGSSNNEVESLDAWDITNSL